MRDVTCREFDDPGPGARLGADVRTAFAEEIRMWRRGTPGALLLQVHGDAWHHAPEAHLDYDRVEVEYQTLVKGLFGLSCPVVVSLDGQVSGFGLALAMAADVRLATNRTTLAVGSPLAGLLGGVGWLITRAVGSGTFAQLAWTGATLTAEEAVCRGLLSLADEPGMDRALAQRFATDPVGFSALKRALNSRVHAGLGTTLCYEAWLADVAANELA
jgi:enoyl-CoA hydratase/carnithine racemase